MEMRSIRRMFSWSLLCVFVIVAYCCWRHAEYSNMIRTYQSDRLLLVRPGTFELGGIGNNVFELISSVGIAKATGRTLLLPSEIYEKINMQHPELVNILDGIYPEEKGTIRSAHHIDRRNSDCCRYDHNIINSIDYPRKSVFAADLNYLQSYLYFLSLSRSEILSRLELGSQVQSAVQREISSSLSDYDNILCVHSRRGDFLTSRVQTATNATFLLDATNYLFHAQKTNSSLVLLIGDDIKWQKSIEETLRDKGINVQVLPRFKSSSPVVDWHVSRTYCDSVLLTASSSTFGWWLAYLSKGQRVFYNSEFSTNSKLLDQFQSSHFFPSSWIALDRSLFKS